MKLCDALNLLREIPVGADSIIVWLASGFTALHLETLLAAEIWWVSRKKAEIRSGLYGDLLGSLRKGGESGAHFVVCAVEWFDLDPRLGWRALGGWSPALFPDICETTKRQMLEIQRSVGALSGTIPVVVSLPTLSLPPISFTSKEQASGVELELRACVAASAVRLAELPNVHVLNVSQLERLSSTGERLDLKSDLLTGFPYSLPHAAAMAALFARLISGPAPKKGLITDLDETLWKGIVGEVGAVAVGWTLECGAQVHGLYQQLLAALADAGVLVAVASKNDPEVVDAVFARRHLILGKERLFPIEASWEPKSRAVARILREWNVSADSVVFVDDDAMELAEVAASHPGIECLQFPARDYKAAYRLFEKLRDCFGKARLLDEDLLRSSSLRQATSELSPAALSSHEDFLDQAAPEISAEFCASSVEPRALELVNKTNQFNLNGERHTYTSLLRRVQSPGGFMMLVSYKDKYGPLGKIAVLAGSFHPNAVQVDIWVMSCRAFSRRIEHWCLEQLFERFRASEVTLNFRATERNAPMRDFLAGLLREPPFTGCKITRADFMDKQSRRLENLLETSHA